MKVCRNKVKEVLIERHLTQSWLSESTGISPQSISGICRNSKTGINLSHLARIAEVLHITNLNELIVLEEK